MFFNIQIYPHCFKVTQKVIFSALVVAAVLAALHSIPKVRLSNVLVFSLRDQNSSINCRNLTNGAGQWHNFSNAIFRLYAYSAFYDDRPSLLSHPVVRIMAVSDVFEDLKKRNVTRLYCILHHDVKDIIVTMEENPKAIGHGWPLNKHEAREYVYNCPTVAGMIPNSVRIVTKQSEYFPSGVPVIVPKKPREQREFCVCVQAAYGTLNPHRIIEWLELQKILGVSLVGIYVLSASEPILKVFRHYSAEGFIDLHPINYIYDGSNKEFWLHLTPAINDCIYRHMYEFRRMVVIDFDEFIMPRKHHNLSELVNYLDKTFSDKKNPHVNYAFRNNYFFLDLPPDDKISPNTTVLRYRKKVAVSPEGYSVKSIINPQACTNMHNHECWDVTANYSGFGNTASVDPDIGLNQHYKKCHFSREECDTLMKNVTRDETVLKFKDLLSERVKEKLALIT